MQLERGGGAGWRGSHAVVYHCSFRQRLVQDLPAGDLALAETFRGEPYVNGARSQFLTDGFTYRDHTGRRHYYQFHYSGADGSLIGSEERIPW